MDKKKSLIKCDYCNGSGREIVTDGAGVPRSEWCGYCNGDGLSDPFKEWAHSIDLKKLTKEEFKKSAEEFLKKNK